MYLFEKLAWDLPVEGGRVAGGWVGARLVALLTDPAPLTAVPVHTRGATRHCQQWYRCRQRALATLGSCDLVLTVWDRATRQTWQRCLTMYVCNGQWRQSRGYITVLWIFAKFTKAIPK